MQNQTSEGSVWSSDESNEYVSSVGDEGSQSDSIVDEVKQVHKLAQKETKDVRVWKLMMLLAILTTAALVSAGTYIFLRQAEDADYQDSVSKRFANWSQPSCYRLRLQLTQFVLLHAVQLVRQHHQGSFPVPCTEYPQLLQKLVEFHHG